MTQPSTPAPDTAGLDAATLRRLGLRTQPFADRTTEGFVYCDPSLDMPVGVLLQRLQTDNKPLLLVGEAGVGKSTQLIQLLSRGAAALSFCAFKGRTGASFEAIAHAIRQQWGPATAQRAPGATEEEAADPAPEGSSLARILLSTARGTQRPVLVIDDAHLLTPAVLGALLRLRREVNRHSGNTMGIVLAGEPVLNGLVNAAYGDDVPAERHAVIRLRPLTGSQTEAYLRHRLQAAGAPDPDLLSGAVAETIQQESAGLPGRINPVANRHLQELASEPSAETPARRTDAYAGSLAGGPHWVAPAAAGAMGVLIGALVASLFFLAGDRSAHPDEERPGEARDPVQTVPEPTPLPAPDLPASREMPPAAAVTPTRQPVPETPLPTVAFVPEGLPWQRPLPEPVPPGEAGADLAPLPETDDAVAPGTEPAAGIADAQPLEDPSASTGASPAAEAGAGPGDEPALALSGVEGSEAGRPDAEPSPPEPTAGDAPPEIAEDAVPGRAEPTQAAAEPAPPEPAAGPLGPDWVRQRPPEQFTIQVIAGADLEALQRFARRMAIETEVAWFRTRRGEQDWYALVTGQYPDLTSARAAASQLPVQVRRNEPWIRTFRSVQQSMDPA